MSFSSAVAGLAELRAELAKLPRVGERAASLAAGRLTADYQASFAARTGPNGEPFSPTVKGTTPSLRKSGRLFSQVRFVQAGTQLRVSLAAVPYAKYQIKRGILPRGGAPVPARWKAILDTAGSDAIREALG